jgi:hypothetical protein
MGNAGTRARGFTALGVIAALAAGAVLAASPATAAETPDVHAGEERVVGALITNRSIVINQPVKVNRPNDRDGAAAAAAWWQADPTKVSYSRPAVGSTGPIVVEGLDQCVTAVSLSSIAWAACDGSPEQQFTAAAVAHGGLDWAQYRSVSNAAYLFAEPTTGTGSLMGLSMSSLGMTDTLFSTLTDTPVVAPVPTPELVVTGPADDAVVAPESVVFEGTGNPGERVEVRDAEGNVLGDAVVGDDGSWTVTVPSLPEGPNSLVVVSGEDEVPVSIVVVGEEESTPLIDPLVGGAAASMLLLGTAGTLAVRRRTMQQRLR